MVKIHSFIAKLLIAVLLCGLIPFYSVHPSSVFAADSYDDLRIKYYNYINGGSSLNTSDPDISLKISEITATAQSAWSTMIMSPNRITLWSDLPYIAVDSGQLASSYFRIRNMALAYRTNGSGLYGNASLKNDILNGLQFLYGYYNENTLENSNWWYFEIGIPQSLGDTMILMYDYIPLVKTAGVYDLVDYSDAIDHFYTNPFLINVNTSPATGANRAWRSEGLMYKGILTKSSTNISTSRDMLSDVFLNATTSDGFYDDGSFLQHIAHPYTMGYGASLLKTIAKLLYLLGGTSWDVTDPNKNNVYTWVHEGFEMAVYNGNSLRSLNGRQSTMSTGTNMPTLISALTVLSQIADTTNRNYMQSLMAHWASFYTNIYQQLYLTLTLNELGWFKQFYGVIQPASQNTKLKIWGNMDRVITQTPNYAFELATVSNRVYDFEALNMENLNGWFQGSGMTYVHTNDINQYNDGYYATVNPYRLPGITVVKDTAFNYIFPVATVKDAYVRAGSYANLNYGTDGSLYVKTAPVMDFTRNSYLEFEPAINSAAVISVKLRLYGKNSENTAPVPISVIGTTFDDPTIDPDAWSENAITWSQSPLNTSTTVLDTVYVDGTEKYYEWDVTEYARAEVFKNRKLTFKLFSPDANSPLVTFHSDENATFKPEIIVSKVASTNYGRFSWNGGSQLMDQFGAVGMQYGQFQQTLTAKKSWFIFDNEIVALGSDIDSTDQKTIESVVDNRKIANVQDATIKLNGVTQNLTIGTEYANQNITSASLTSSSGIGNMGYYFPGGTNLNAKREQNTGSYKDNDWIFGSPQIYTKEFLNLWFDHGISPTDGSYKYVLLPAFNSQQTDAYAANPDITVLENSTEAHAVKENTLNITGINFWNDQAKTVGNVTSNKKSSVMVKETASTFEVGVSDPTFSNPGTIDITLNTPLYSVISKDPQILVTRLGSITKLQVNVNGASGKTFHIVLGKNGTWNSNTGFTAQQNLEIANENKVLTEFDITPHSLGINGLIGYADSNKQVGSFADLNLAIQLDSNNLFNASNGANFEAANFMAYSANQTYHALISVDKATYTYDAWIKPANGAYVMIAHNFSLQNAGAGINLGKIVLSGSNANDFTVANHTVFAKQHTQSMVNEDTYLYGGSPTTNYGTGTNLVIKDAAGTTFDRITWLKSSLAQYQTIFSGQLNFYVNTAGPTSAPLKIYGEPSDSWNEASATWSSSPAATGEVLIGTVNVTAPGWYSIDVSNFVIAQKAADQWASFKIVDESNSNILININSKENQTNQAYLNIENMDVAATPAFDVFSNVAMTADTYNHGGTPTTNYGSSSSLVIKDAVGTTYDRISWMKTYFTSYPSISSANLNVYVNFTSNSAASVPVKIYGVPSDSWSESTATWNSPPVTTGEVLLGTINVSGTGWYSIDVTGFAQSQKITDEGATFKFVDESASDVQVNISSKENTVIATKPFITLK